MERLLLIVEGHGEISAGRVLISRILQEKFEIYTCSIELQRRKDICHLKSRGWTRFRDYLRAAYLENCPILWILDCDDDCALEIAQELTQQANSIPVRQAVAFALLPREFETMFLYDIDAAITALSLDPKTQRPAEPKEIRGAKGWLSRQMKGNGIYKETVDQPRITARLNLDMLEQDYRDFRHLIEALRWLCTATEPATYPM